MRKTILVITFTYCCNIYGQDVLPGVFEPGPPENPCNSLNDEFAMSKKQVPYAYVRESAAVWEKRVWREIDLREKQNFPLYFPLQFQPCRISLFQLVSKHLKSGELLAFGDESFSNPLSKEKVRSLLIESEEVERIIYDVEGNQIVDTVLSYDSVSVCRDVIKIRLKEDWFLNGETSSLEVRIVGMAFYKYIEEKEGYKELFWIYYPSARPYLVKYKVFNPSNEGDSGSFDDLFRRRQFASRITKESNMYDRDIAEYCKGIDALLESDRVKYNIFKFEHDLWHY